MRLRQHVLFMAGALFLLVGRQSLAQTAASFAPFEEWKKAVEAGDKAALAKLYSTNPPVQVGRTKGGNLDDELRFWAGLKASGVTEFRPKVLDIASLGGTKRLVLRVEYVGGSRATQVIPMAQVWAPQEDGWRITATQRGIPHREDGRRLPEPRTPNPRLYSDPSEARAELKAASTAAARDHKRVLVMFGANWCYDCHVLDTTLHSKEFAPLLEANYVLVHINLGEEEKDNNDLAAELGVGLNKGIPSLGVLEPDGKVVFAQKDGEFESTMKIGPEDVRAFLEKWKPASAR